MPRKNIPKKKKHTRKKISLNAVLWTIVLTIIIMYALVNFKTIQTTIGKLSNNSNNLQKPTSPVSATDDTEPETRPEVDDSIQAPEKQEGLLETIADEDPVIDGINTTIYLVQVQPDGTPTAVARKRKIPKTPAVLTETIKTLLVGTTSEEESKGLRSFIPSGSKLLSISVKNRIAYINFDGSFQFNPGGRNAATAQIFQIVYTSTEFKNIDKVKILINGKTVAFLTGEGGIPVDKPLGRESISYE